MPLLPSGAFCFMAVKIIKDDKGKEHYFLEKGKEIKKEIGYFTIFKRRWFDDWEGLNAIQRSIMVSLWLYGAGTGQAWASMRLLAVGLGTAVSTIDENIKKLEKLGFFKIGKGKGRGRYFNIYKLLK